MKKGEFKHTIHQDLKDIYQFYLDQDARDRLARMGRIRRWISIFIWLAKSLVQKLNPARRILLIISLFLFFSIHINYESNQFQINIGSRTFGYLIILFILMLELKDKLLARDELKAGHAVQAALMPDTNPVLAGWDIWLFTRPANDVGGDLVDYIKLTDNRLGIALGDVAGKGLGAALLMAKLQATIRAIVPNHRSLAKFGKHLNEIFCRDGLPERFISLIYFELKAKTGTIRILNSGHLPPITIQNHSIKEMAHGTAALGLKRNVKYKEQHIKLRPGGLFIAYTDGLTEARNTSDEFFGEKRLLEIVKLGENLSMKEIGKRLIQEVDQFIGDAKVSDDLSFVFIKRSN